MRRTWVSQEQSQGKRMGEDRAKGDVKSGEATCTPFKTLPSSSIKKKENHIKTHKLTNTQWDWMWLQSNQKLSSLSEMAHDGDLQKQVKKSYSQEEKTWWRFGRLTLIWRRDDGLPEATLLGSRLRPISWYQGASSSLSSLSVELLENLDRYRYTHKSIYFHIGFFIVYDIEYIICILYIICYIFKNKSEMIKWKF